MRKRKTRKEKRRQRKLLTISMISLLCVMSIGYAAFQTDLNITARGNIKKLMAADTLKKKCNATSGDGLYKDEFETGRCLYKGADPDNYITFNNEMWRIISVENDGTIKIIRNKGVGSFIVFDEWRNRDLESHGAGGTYCAQANYGCNAWAISSNFVNGSKSGTVLKDASLNTYLNNEYYNSLSSDAKKLIEAHNFNVGSVTPDNSDLVNQIDSEKGIIWNGKIGLITVSEYLRANPNTELCGTINLNNTNASTCNKNYIRLMAGIQWTISLNINNTSTVLTKCVTGDVCWRSVIDDDNPVELHPVLYLTPNITLSGSGTSSDPYIIN